MNVLVSHSTTGGPLAWYQRRWGMHADVGDTPDLVGIGDRYLRCSGFNEVFRMPITVQSWVRVRTVLTLSLSRPLLANIAQDTVNDDSYGTLSNTRPSYYTWSIHWYISLFHVSDGRIRQDASSKVSTSGRKCVQLCNVPDNIKAGGERNISN